MQTASVEVVSRGRHFQVLAMESEAQTRTIGVIPLQKGGRDDLEIGFILSVRLWGTTMPTA